MSRFERLRNLDYAALAMMVVYTVVFREDLGSVADVTIVLGLLGSALFLWWGLAGGLKLGWRRRLLVISALSGHAFFFSALPKTRPLLGVYLVAYLMFSVSGSSWGRCLRCLSGIVAASVLFTSFSPVFGLPMSLLALVVFVGGFLSVWSGMDLDKSILWFAKRSFRKETFFLLLFLTGVASIGIRQAQLYSERQYGVSGLSADLSPGGVKKLLLSDALAMRIKFKSHPPFDPSQGYIRAVALDLMNGFDWSIGPSRILSATQAVEFDFENQISLSPRHSQFTPVLDYGVNVSDMKSKSSPLGPRDNGVFSLRGFDVHWKHYESKNRLVPLHRLDEADLRRLLLVDPRTEEQLKTIAKDISGGARNVGEFIERLNVFYKDRGFSYSLNLKRESGSPGEFLIVTKEGFCEHYAAASAILARLSGFPARIVSGFLGGFWDAGKMTLFVRDLDAHAWNEFWDRDKNQWVRFDAVSVLAPERIQNGGANFLRLAGYDVPDDSEFDQGLWFTDFTITLNDFLAGLNSDFSVRASETLVEYGEELALLGAMGLTVSYIVLVRRRHRKYLKRPDIELISELRKRLGAAAPSKNKGESVAQWLKRCSEVFPHVAREITSFSDAHSRYCHSADRSKEDLRVMGQAVRRIRRLVK